MKIYQSVLVRRWDSVMNRIGCEHLTITGELSELKEHRVYHELENGRITADWMLQEAQYWLSCYYEKGNVRCDSRFESEEDYQIWASEVGALKRLIRRLKKVDGDTVMAVFRPEWE